MDFFSKILKRRKTIFLVFLFVAVFSFGLFGIKIDTAEALSCSDVTFGIGTCLSCCASPALFSIPGIIIGSSFLQGCMASCNNAYGPGAPANGCPAAYSPVTIGKQGADGYWSCDTASTTTGSNTCATCIDKKDVDNGESFPQGILDSFKSLVPEIADLFMWGAFKIAAYSAYLLDYIVFAIMAKTITTAASNPSFIPEWTQMRNLANMIIVLGFIVIGIATALRIQEYTAKKLLPKLIIIALLVNFSGLFCGLIIDASNLTMKGIMGNPVGTYGSTMAQTALATVRVVSHAMVDPSTLNNGWSEIPGLVGTCILFIFVYLAFAFTFLYLSILLLARYAILAMLFILSPLAFVFWVFPASSHLFKEWSGHFLRWAFVGIFGSLVLYIATSLIKNASTTATTSGGTTIVFFLALVFLYVGFKITCKNNGLAAMAGGAVIGLATGVAGFAVGAGVKAVTGGAKMADAGLKVGTGAISKKLGGSGEGVSVGGAVKRIGSGTGKFMEKVGLRKQGSTARNAAQGMKDVSDRVNQMSTEDLVSASKGNAYSADAIAVKAEATRKLAKDGNINKIGNMQEQAAAVTSAENYFKGRGMGSGDVRSNAVKVNPLLATAQQKHIDAAIEDEAQGMVSGGGAATIEAARAHIKKNYGSYTHLQEAANREARAEAFAKSNIGDIRKFSNETLESHEFIENTPANKIEQSAREMSGSQVGSIQSHRKYLIQEARKAAPNSDRRNELNEKRDTLTGLS